MERLLQSIPDAANSLSIGRSKLYELIADGKVETVSIGRRRLVKVASLRAIALGAAA